MITFKPSQYLSLKGKLDELSITELEHLMTAPSGSFLYRLLFARKMSQPYHPSFAVLNNDYVLRTFGFSETLTVPEFKMMQNNTSDIVQSVEPSHDNMNNIKVPKSEVDGILIQESLPKSENHLDRDEKLIEPTKTITRDSETDKNNESPIIDDYSEFPKKEINPAFLTEKYQSSEKKVQKGSENKRKKKKNSKNKFKLTEFSGISGYSKWLLSFHRNDVEKRIAREKKVEKKRRLAEIARKSITKSHEVASEPLADLLAQQGHFDDAKKMYEQLMHKNPEKSRYFAAKLEDLLKNIENNNL